MRYKVESSPRYGPPQYLGGVGKYDVFYWTAAHEGKERLIVKWNTGDYTFYWWDSLRECWKNSYSERVDEKGPSPSETEAILAMYQCFAIKPDRKQDDARQG
jgi:hypothetical protein